MISRRLVLRGFAGTALSLPLLELTHGAAWAQGLPARAQRFALFFEHGGTLCNIAKDGERYSGEGKENGVDAWKPASEGEALQLGAIHAPLADHADALLLLRGIDNIACKHDSDFDGDHGFANVSALTQAKTRRSGPETYAVGGPSIDFVLAQRLAQRTPVPFPLVSLYMHAHNYGTPFYAGPNQANPGQFDPLVAFKKLFANVQEPGMPPDPALERARALKKSVLDGTSEGLRQLRPRLGATDRRSIDAHLEHLRSLELRVAQLPPPPRAECKKPKGVTGPWDPQAVDPKIGELHVDLLIAAFRCGITNVATLEIGDFHATWLSPSYPASYDIGHSLDHAATEVGKDGPDGARFQAWYDTVLANRRWRMTLLARFLDGMKATPEGDGSMLDQSAILWTSEFAMGGAHGVSDVPVLLAGRAGGKWKTGRHLNYNLKASTGEYQTHSGMHNLLTSVLHAFGYDDANFGATYGDYTKPTGQVVAAYKQGPLQRLGG